MSKDRKKKKITDEGELTSGGGDLRLTIGSILGKEGVSAERGSSPAPEAEIAKQAAAPGGLDSALGKLSKATLHRQSSGKGGKTVTVVTLSKEAFVGLDELARQMRVGLGCGSRVEDGKVILQGELQERARDWLLKKGVKKVVLGN